MDWKTLTSLGRFKDIVMVLLRNGFDDLVDRLKTPGNKFMRKKVPSTKVAWRGICWISWTFTTRS